MKAQKVFADSVAVKPLRDMVHVELLDALPSDIIYIPEAYRDMPVRGKVLAVGPKQQDVMVGDIVQFHFGGMEAYYPDRKHGVVSGKHLQCVIGPLEPVCLCKQSEKRRLLLVCPVHDKH